MPAPDPHPLVRETLFGMFVGLLNAAGTAIIILLMVLITADVVARNLLGAPLPGVVEMSEAGIVMLVYLQVGHTLRVNRFIRSDGLLLVIRERRPHLAMALGLFFNLTGAILFFLICYAVRERVGDAWSGEYFIGIQGMFTFPVWPIELAILTGSAVMAVQFAIFAASNAASLARREKP